MMRGHPPSLLQSLGRSDLLEEERAIAALIFAGDLDEEATLRAVVMAAQRALGADRVTCYVHASDQSTIISVYTSETDPEIRRFIEAVSGRTRQDLPIWDLVISRDDPLYTVPDVRAATHLSSYLRGRLGAGAFLGIRLEHASVQTPDAHPALLGTLFASWRKERRFSADEELSARHLAGLAGIALANARLSTQRNDLETELRRAQRLEAVGQLAGGLAHEINTPIQFIADSVQFLDDAFAEMRRLIARYRADVQAAAATTDLSALLDSLAAADRIADLDFLEEQIPQAIAQSRAGTERLTETVLAMKHFAHLQREDRQPTDLNGVIESALIVVRHETDSVAVVSTHLGDIPPVVCDPGDLSQVVVNLVINAAHAFDDAGGSPMTGSAHRRGSITISTRRDGDEVVIAIADTGCGIPAPIRDRVFDPFFTTREIGRALGQGLTIAYALVTTKHGGSLSFETEEGVGTTFTVRLPIAGAPKRRSGPSVGRLDPDPGGLEGGQFSTGRKGSAFDRH